MDEDGIPGMGTYAVPGFGGDMPPMHDSSAPTTPPSQVPGTSGAPAGYTPSATPGGVSTGNPGGQPAQPPGGGQTSPWGSLAAMLGLNAPQSAANAMKPGQGLRIAQLGMRMLAPPASPLRQGAPPPQLSAAGQSPQVAQFQQMFGVDYQTALAACGHSAMCSGAAAVWGGSQPLR